ncbi:peptide chain release factor N(5)-glutamine methyltransferase [Thermostichus vulcanus]|uniref:Release factor glutamine methyltransferase n=1 Tax=Thermostichus vulcanus str. 'Rupite' TaxID=2813851 RepID=A0ABT0CCW4_THEVL|nr:peptide chain release factor N(5)-glutamine methyltransferase [Thermostichus vulcanus]MCJ2543633.1 peptide chain release factor N(5)-glutamine methyltransferase [Thermostichus vulcanus str. 'Rupite']
MGALPQGSTAARLEQWRLQALGTAQAAGIPSEEVDILLREKLGWGPLQRLMGQEPVGKLGERDPLEEVQALWQRRLEERIPLQYLLGQVEWAGLSLQVTPAVLIPRPETELVVEQASLWLQANPLPQGSCFADLGTGSGAIAIALARQHPNLQLLAVDSSPEALAVAAANVAAHTLEERVQLRLGSWFVPLEPWRGQLRGLLSNPPYIPSGEIPNLMPEVGWHEPRQALDGGPDGLEALRLLIQVAPEYLAPNSFWAVEVMQGQAPWVVEQLQALGCYQQIQVHLDLAGIERVVSAHFLPSS